MAIYMDKCYINKYNYCVTFDNIEEMDTASRCDKRSRVGGVRTLDH